MEINWLDDAPERSRSLAVGMFDGVHLGHAEVVAGVDAVVSFEPHPRALLSDGPDLIADVPTKAERLATLGVEELVLVPFDREMAGTEPQSFVEDILQGALGAVQVSVGENFRFGRGASGTAETLLVDDRFETRVTPLFKRDGDVVSSTRIRELIKKGKIEKAVRLLGAPFRVRCGVVGSDPGGEPRLTWPDPIVQPPPGAYCALLHDDAVGITRPVSVLIDHSGIRLNEAMSPKWEAAGLSTVVLDLVAPKR
jgi:riboflavin kinase/FMN adenylyltransferase